jgi:hypothetical protein
MPDPKIENPESSEDANLNSLPSNSALPLKVTRSEKIASHGDSTVWKTAVLNNEAREELIALKQLRKEQFATPEAMKEDKKFYDYLKNFPGFGEFVPETMFFIAREKQDGPAQGFRLQRFIHGKPIDEVPDEELYRDPAVVRQLKQLAEVVPGILREAKKNKTHNPDFRRAPGGEIMKARIGGWISDPRYTKNIIIADKADENGQRVFFVDTGVNATERTRKSEEFLSRYIVNPLERFHFIFWRNKIEKVLKDQGKESEQKED